ncbi:unannotated protein [freshwater metagenome]|uniref:Unannotated protein n=1 Tax=freshwater metagenome TaxID=449393 RepID=A0A6J6Y4V9_9ZZZZ
MLLPVRTELGHFGQAREHLDVGIHREAQLAQHLQRAVMRRELVGTHDLADLIAPKAEHAAGRDARIFLTQASGGRVARVHEQLLSGLSCALIHCLETGERHIDLAADFDDFGNIGPHKAMRNGSHREHVGSDVFAHAAIAACGCLHQHAALIAQADCQPVDLELAHKLNRFAFEATRDSLTPCLKFGRIHRIVEAGHWHAMRYRSKGGRTGAAHPARG